MPGIWLKHLAQGLRGSSKTADVVAVVVVGVGVGVGVDGVDVVVVICRCIMPEDVQHPQGSYVLILAATKDWRVCLCVCKKQLRVSDK